MITNGYKLKELLKLKKMELTANLAKIKTSFYVFEEELDKGTPIELSENIMVLEKDLATIQTAQKYYNINSIIKIDGFEEMSLEMAIKLLGGYNRKSKMFRDFLESGLKRSRYSSSERGPKIRSKDTEYQTESITQEDALKEAMGAEVKASNIKTAISLANGRDMEINFLDDIL